MKKSIFSVLVISIFFASCTTFQPHSSEITPVRLENGMTQVMVKLHDKDKVEVGSPVNSYSISCYQKTSTKGFERTVCNNKIVGEGKIIKLNEDRMALVEFPSDVQILQTTQFEVKQ